MREPPGELALHLECTLPATPERVFAACVEPEALAEWWGPAGFTAPSIELDVRVGGRYRIAMQPPEGELFHLRGIFVDVDPPHRLAYTFEWEEPDPDDQGTVVRLAFDATGEGTRFVLDQGSFRTRDRYELHHAGWSDGLVRLRHHLERTMLPA